MKHQEEFEVPPCRGCGGFLMMEVDERGLKAYVCRKCGVRDEFVCWRTRITIRHPAAMRLLGRR